MPLLQRCGPNDARLLRCKPGDARPRPCGRPGRVGANVIMPPLWMETNTVYDQGGCGASYTDVMQNTPGQFLLRGKECSLEAVEKYILAQQYTCWRNVPGDPPWRYQGRVGQQAETGLSVEIRKNENRTYFSGVVYASLLNTNRAEDFQFPDHYITPCCCPPEVCDTCRVVHQFARYLRDWTEFQPPIGFCYSGNPPPPEQQLWLGQPEAGSVSAVWRLNKALDPAQAVHLDVADLIALFNQYGGTGGVAVSGFQSMVTGRGGDITPSLRSYRESRRWGPWTAIESRLYSNLYMIQVRFGMLNQFTASGWNETNPCCANYGFNHHWEMQESSWFTVAGLVDLEWEYR